MKVWKRPAARLLEGEWVSLYDQGNSFAVFCGRTVRMRVAMYRDNSYYKIGLANGDLYIRPYGVIISLQDYESL